MFNVTVLRMKDIIKYLVGIFITIIVVMITTRYFSSKSQEKDSDKINLFDKITSFFSKVPDEVLTSSVSTEIPVTRYFQQNIENEEQNSQKEKSIYEKILDSEIGAIESIDANLSLAESEENAQVENTNESEEENTEPTESR